MALVLSHQIVGVSVQLKPISENRDCNQLISALAKAKALYSLSALDLAMTDCFLDDHDIKLFPK